MRAGMTSFFFLRESTVYIKPRFLQNSPEQRKKLQLGPSGPRCRRRRRERDAGAPPHHLPSALEREDPLHGREVDAARLRRASALHRHHHRRGQHKPQPSSYTHHRSSATQDLAGERRTARIHRSAGAREAGAPPRSSTERRRRRGRAPAPKTTPATPPPPRRRRQKPQKNLPYLQP
jgi:hypothetical protein